MPKRRPEVNEPNVGDERLDERDERGRITEQEDLGRSPRRGSGRDMETDLERGNTELDVEVETEDTDR